MTRCAVCKGPGHYDGAIDAMGQYVCIDCWANGSAQIAGKRAQIAAPAKGTPYDPDLNRRFIDACNGADMTSSSKTTTQLTAEYVECEQKKRELKQTLDALNKHQKEIEGQLIERFEADGVQSLNMNGHTVYLQRFLSASVATDQDSAIEAFTAYGLADLARTSILSQTLSAWVREQEDQGETIPEEIAHHIRISEGFKLGCRKA